MFRDEQAVVESTIGTWQSPRSEAASVASACPRRFAFDAFANDEIGAVWHVYREIATRIPRNAYTRHSSKLARRAALDCPSPACGRTLPATPR